ncbi:hypothetical protein FHY15_001506 [Xanthomonas arboricola]|uniref:hypothetical protein n=1 Tax=Xanthomonas arboricola TaxID=56448 RepID=UPI0012DB652C|nr:hypothetical protein [Xanthomonas arboricola]NIK32376.1 hypothetical protein [Xanthomonas arboricola]
MTDSTRIFRFGSNRTWSGHAKPSDSFLFTPWPRLGKSRFGQTNPDLAGAPTTIRLSPEARAFFAAQAEAFGQISTSAFIAITLEGVMRATQSNDSNRPQEQLQRRLELSRDRLLHVFHAHSIEPYEIASLLNDYDITAATLHEESAFFPRLQMV